MAKIRKLHFAALLFVGGLTCAQAQETKRSNTRKPAADAAAKWAESSDPSDSQSAYEFLGGEAIAQLQKSDRINCGSAAGSLSLKVYCSNEKIKDQTKLPRDLMELIKSSQGSFEPFPGIEQEDLNRENSRRANFIRKEYNNIVKPLGKTLTSGCAEKMKRAIFDANMRFETQVMSSLANQSENVWGVAHVQRPEILIFTRDPAHGDRVCAVHVARTEKDFNVGIDPPASDSGEGRGYHGN